MPHPPQQQRRLVSTSTKIALAIIVVVGIAAYFYYSPGGINISIPGIGSVGTGLTNIFSGDQGGARLNFTMTSSESFFSGDLTLENATVSATGTQTVETSAGDSTFDNSGKKSTVTFSNFMGTMSTSTGLVVQGTAATAGADGVVIKPKSHTFSVSAKMTPDSYSISPVKIPTISLNGVFGAMQKLGDETSTIQLSNSTVEISDFEGSMSFDGKDYVITGSASQVKGKSFTLKG